MMMRKINNARLVTIHALVAQLKSNVYVALMICGRRILYLKLANAQRDTVTMVPIVYVLKKWLKSTIKKHKKLLEKIRSSFLLIWISQ